MGLYEIDVGSYQRHFIVAKSYAKAEEIWKAKYNSPPKSITFITSYVLVEEKVDEELSTTR